MGSSTALDAEGQFYQLLEEQGCRKQNLDCWVCGEEKLCVGALLAGIV